MKRAMQKTYEPAATQKGRGFRTLSNPTATKNANATT